MKVAHGSATLPFPVQIVVIILPSGPPQSYVIPHLSFFFYNWENFSSFRRLVFTPYRFYIVFYIAVFFVKILTPIVLKKAAVK
jgi:hypothetical protein